MKFYFVSGNWELINFQETVIWPLTELKFVKNMISVNIVCQKYSQ